MNLPPTTRSVTLALQSLISGRVEDGLTNGVPYGALTVRLIDLDTGQDYPLPGRVLPDGTFSFYGLPETAFPRLAEQTYHLRVEAGAPNYQPGTLDFDLGPVAGQPAPVARPVPIDGIPDINVPLFTAGGLPHAGITLVLDRNAVRLRGQVHVSDDPTQFVAGASLELNPPSITTALAGGEGRFEFPDPLPVMESVTLQVMAPLFETANLTYEPDYSQPINDIQIGLKHS